MHNDDAIYRERLTPSIWILAAAAVVAPMAMLSFAPFDTTLALVVGAAAGIGFIALLVALSPVVEVRGGELRARRAHIPVACLGDPVGLTGEEARRARGPGLDPRSWMMFRGGIDGIVVVPVTDPDDPAPAWVLSSRTPERLCAAILAARATPRSPGRSDPQSPRDRAASGA